MLAAARAACAPPDARGAVAQWQGGTCCGGSSIACFHGPRFSRAPAAACSLRPHSMPAPRSPTPPPAASCARCNGEFIPEPLPPSLLPEGHDVPPGVLAAVQEYWVCQRCRCCCWSWCCRWRCCLLHTCGVALPLPQPPLPVGVGCFAAPVAPNSRRPSAPAPLPRCSGVYWQGSQYGRAKREMEQLIAKLSLA